MRRRGPRQNDKTMHITVKLYASFRHGRFGAKAMDFPGGTTICEVAVSLGIPVEQLGIVLRNGTHAGPDDVVAEGDAISLMPDIGGG